MKKLLLILIVLALLVAVPVYIKRADLSVKVFERAAVTMMRANPLADLGPGLHVTLCGAGGPLPDNKRSGPCVAIAAGERLFIVDAGTDGVRNLGRLRYPIGAIEAVFLSHFHSDHIDGLGEMATLRWVQNNNTTPLPVYGPEGVSDVVDGFNHAYARDAIYRNEHHGDAVAPLSGHGMVPRSFPLPEDGVAPVIFEDGGVKVETFSVDHAPVSPAVGYRFTYQGRSVVVSGDTARSANLERFSSNVDLLVHEALSPELVMVMNEAARKNSDEGMMKITIDILDYHTSPVEAAETARDAGAGHLLFYHIVPPLPLPGLEAAWLRGVSDIFPKYTLGEDGTTISLPAGSRDINVVRKGL